MIRVAVTAPAFDAVAATQPARLGGPRGAARRARAAYWQAYFDGVARERAPIKRFATPQGLANFFVFLCSACASFSVGSTYFVDGGMLKSV